MRPLVKVCGVRRVEDALLAVGLGATHVGCVLAQDSPRCARIDEATEIAAAVGGLTRLVLVFRDSALLEVLAATSATGIREVQMHGADESICKAAENQGLRVLRVHSVDPSDTRLPVLAPLPTERKPAVLDVGRGGTGMRFPWDLLRGHAPHATFVAGGVTPDNVGDLLRHAPWGVDVSSGVESAPGIKDPQKLRRLFAALEGTS